MKEYMIPISNRIASEIKRTGLTQEQVGKALGVSHHAVSRWCCAHKGISVKHLMQLCLLLDCSADYILFGGRIDGPIH